MKRYYLIRKKGENSQWVAHQWGEWGNNNDKLHSQQQIQFTENGEYQVSYIEGWTATTQVPQGEGGTEGVDLGLPSGTLWAMTNVDAENPEDAGIYVAWAETDEKTQYYASTYTLYVNSKYTAPWAVRGPRGFQGKLEYDAATVALGNGWMTPSEDQFQELMDECRWEADTEEAGDLKGFRVRSKQEGNTNEIYIPAVGYNSGTAVTAMHSCHYWTSKIYPFPADWDDARTAMEAVMKHEDWGDDIYVVNHGRQFGLPIRPVQYKTPPAPEVERFNVSPLFIDSDTSNIVTNFDGEYHLAGNQLLLLKIDTNLSTSEIGIEPALEGYNVFPLDGYGLLVSKNIEYNSYQLHVGEPNGYEPQAGYIKIEGVVSETPKSFTLTIDKDAIAYPRAILGNGCYVNKIYKVPSTGGTINVKSYIFPDTFDSEAYDEEYQPKVYEVDDDGVLTRQTGLSHDYQSLQSVITFTYGQNTTKTWVDKSYIIKGPQETDGYMVRILQEPSASTRIYYGFPHHPLYAGDYTEIDDDLALENFDAESVTQHDYLFHTLGSAVLGGVFKIEMEEGWDVLIPKTVEDNYKKVVVTIEDGNEVESDTFNDHVDQQNTQPLWGGIIHTWYKFNNKVVVKFIKQYA